MQLGGRHGEHLGAGFEILIRDGQRDPELVTASVGIHTGTNDKPRLDFLFRLQEAHEVDRRLVVERKIPTVPTMIDGDLVSVDRFDNTRKDLALFILGGNSAGGKDQADGDDDACRVGIHEIRSCR